MKRTIITTALLLALIPTAEAGGIKDWAKQKRDQLRGHQTEQPQELDTVEVKGEQGKKPQVDQQKAMQSAERGCAIGSLLGSLAGVDPQAACAAGGLAGWSLSARKQLKEARGIEQAAKDAGMQATVTTDTTTTKGKATEAMKSLTVSYDPRDMEDMTAGSRTTLDKIAGMLSKAKDPLSVTVEGNNDCQTVLTHLNESGALKRHSVNNKCGKKAKAHRITIARMGGTP